MPSPVRARPSQQQLQAAVMQLEALLAANTEIDPVARKEVSEHLDEVRSLLEAPPRKLTAGGLNDLNAMTDAEAGQGGSEGASTVVDCPFQPQERERVEAEWMRLCWIARRDMCEEEMLMLTEKTFRRLVHCYALEPHAEDDVVRYWLWLVRQRLDNKQQKSACAKSESAKPPAERNAGDVITAQAAASQRSKALPTGVTSGNYSPEVYSPTAALWAKSPEEKAASLRRSTEKARSATGTAKSASRSPRRGSTRAGTDILSASSPRSPRGQLSPKLSAAKLKGTERVTGSATIDTGDKRKSEGFGPGWRNSKSWNTFW